MLNEYFSVDSLHRSKCLSSYKLKRFFYCPILSKATIHRSLNKSSYPLTRIHPYVIEENQGFRFIIYFSKFFEFKCYLNFLSLDYKSSSLWNRYYDKNGNFRINEIKVFLKVIDKIFQNECVDLWQKVA